MHFLALFDDSTIVENFLPKQALKVKRRKDVIIEIGTKSDIEKSNVQQIIDSVSFQKNKSKDQESSTNKWIWFLSKTVVKGYKPSNSS